MLLDLLGGFPWTCWIGQVQVQFSRSVQENLPRTVSTRRSRSEPDPGMRGIHMQQPNPERQCAQLELSRVNQHPAIISDIPTNLQAYPHLLRNCKPWRQGSQHKGASI